MSSEGDVLTPVSRDDLEPYEKINVVAKHPFDINVDYPKQVKIKLVNASKLADYEIVIFLTSLFSNFSVGFWISYATAKSGDASNWPALIFSVLTICFFIWSFIKRSEMEKYG